MKINITPFTLEHAPAVHAFNRRLQAGGVSTDFSFPEEPARAENTASPKHPHEEFFVALEGDTVRGAYILRHHAFMVHGVARTISQYRLPISEGVIDRTYVGIGFRLLRDALQARPLLFTLGMGGLNNPLPRMLEAASWTMSGTRFYFRACHPHTVMRGLAYERVARATRGPGGSLVAGLGALALAAVHSLQPAVRLPAGVSWTIVDEFDESADGLWHACHAEYSMIAIRDREVLNGRYSSRDGHFIIAAVSRNDAVIGWVVLLDTKMIDHRQFGNLRVGSIVDCLAASHDAVTVIAVANKLLDDRHVDLIISNQAHATWTKALRVSGFLQGPSNFVFAASPALTALLEPFALSRPRIHLNRGDGDGPIHL